MAVLNMLHIDGCNRFLTAGENNKSNERANREPPNPSTDGECQATLLMLYIEMVAVKGVVSRRPFAKLNASLSDEIYEFNNPASPAPPMKKKKVRVKQQNSGCLQTIKTVRSDAYLALQHSTNFPQRRRSHADPYPTQNAVSYCTDLHIEA
jgi:hypothetical protein